MRSPGKVAGGRARPGTMVLRVRVLTATLLPVALSVLHPAPARGLTYLNASPSGAAFPEWEGGDTELEFADVNADGNTDLISIGDHGSPYINADEHGVMVYFTDGAGGWAIHMEGNFGYGGICAGDADNDGWMDVGCGMHHNYSSTDFGDQLLEVALGDGTGMHWTPWDDGLAANGETYGMAAVDFADFDGDGLLDLAASSFGCCNGVHVYRNQGDGTWSQTFARTGGNVTMFIDTGDVNGDGHADVAASYQNGCVWLGDGMGNFTAADTGLPAPGTVGLRGVSLGDVDGDGCDDLAFVKNGAPNVYVWRADHWEAANSGLPATGSYRAAQLFDLDVDGDLDLAAMAAGLGSVWLGDGLGNWTDGGGFSSGPGSDISAFRVGGDIDHNGRADCAILQEVTSGFDYQNFLYVYRESTPYGERLVRVHEPRIRQTWRTGAIRHIRWASARAATPAASARIELSASGAGGPWVTVADSLPDTGNYQWTVVGSPSAQACIRVTVAQDGVEVAAVSELFRIVPGDPAEAGDMTPRGGALRLEVIPNPAAGVVQLRWFEGAAHSPSVDQARTITPAGRITIHDVAGRLVRHLTLDGLTAGPWTWDGSDAVGRRAPAGVYLARVETSGISATQRIVLLSRR